MCSRKTKNKDVMLNCNWKEKNHYPVMEKILK